MTEQYYEITHFSYNSYSTEILTKDEAIRKWGGERFIKALNANAWLTDMVAHPCPPPRKMVQSVILQTIDKAMMGGYNKPYLEYIKKLINKFPDTNQWVEQSTLDAILKEVI